MARDPETRYATMMALREDLHRFLDGRPPLARRPPLRVQIVQWASMNPAIAVTTALIVLGSLFMTAYLARQNWKFATAWRESESRTREAKEELLKSLLHQARERPHGRVPGRRFETMDLLDRVDRLAREIGLRDRPEIDRSLQDSADAARAEADLQPIPTGHRLTPETVGIEFDPDTGRLGRIEHGGSLVLHAAGADGPTVRYTNGPYVQFQFLPSGDGVLARTAANELRFLAISPRALPAATAIPDAHTGTSDPMANEWPYSIRTASWAATGRPTARSNRASPLRCVSFDRTIRGFWPCMPTGHWSRWRTNNTMVPVSFSICERARRSRSWSDPAGRPPAPGIPMDGVYSWLDGEISEADTIRSSIATMPTINSNCWIRGPLAMWSALVHSPERRHDHRFGPKRARDLLRLDGRPHPIRDPHELRPYKDPLVAERPTISRALQRR